MPLLHHICINLSPLCRCHRLLTHPDLLSTHSQDHLLCSHRKLSWREKSIIRRPATMWNTLRFINKSDIRNKYRYELYIQLQPPNQQNGRKTISEQTLSAAGARGLWYFLLSSSLFFRVNPRNSSIFPVRHLLILKQD